MAKAPVVKAKSLISRISGISVGLTSVGVSWKPKDNERDIIRGLLIYLEDRRVFSVHRHRENTEHVVLSLLDIRKEITSCLQKLSDESKANESLKLMRGACSTFLTSSASKADHAYAHPEFFVELGMVRTIFGQQVAILGYLYGVDIDENLAEILPPKI